MLIKKVETIEEARVCDTLLTKLIQDESKYNKLINPNFVVNNYFTNIYDNTDNCLLIATNEDSVTGYIFVKRIESETSDIVVLIDGLYVEKEYRNQGIASSLIDSALAWCKENSINAVKIKVMTNNENALKLYQKYGFNELSKELINYL